MKNLKHHLKFKGDDELLKDLKDLRSDEKLLVAEILSYLLEVERRELFKARGYDSMYRFCHAELGYSKDESYIRIQAMRLYQELPMVQERINAGTLSLYNAAQIQQAFNKEDKRREATQQSGLNRFEKANVLLKVENQSTRDCKQVLNELFSEEIKVAENKIVKTPIHFFATSEQMKKYKKLKELLSHKDVADQWALFFSEIADIALESLEAETPKKPISIRDRIGQTLR